MSNRIFMGEPTGYDPDLPRQPISNEDLQAIDDASHEAFQRQKGETFARELHERVFADVIGLGIEPRDITASPVSPTARKAFAAELERRIRPK